jgi:hypothetical protein
MAGRMYFILFCILLGTTAFSQDWELRNTKDGIKTYSRKVTGSKIEALKMESDFNATASQLSAIIFDIGSCTEWLYSTKSCSVVKTISPAELYYYSEISFPWPTDNRDFVSHIKAEQDPSSKTVTIRAENVYGFVPEKKGIVRIYKSVGKWTIRPAGPKKVHVEYELQVDPGGSLPSWMVNMLSTKGPLESFKKLREQLRKPKYANARLSVIPD